VAEKPSNMSRSSGTKFEPVDLSSAPSTDSSLPPEIWSIVQSAPANFNPEYFLEVSRNLLENPNLTATYLSRAELSYTSFTDSSFNPDAKHAHELASIVKHLKPDHQPRIIPEGVPGYRLEWTVVRKLIPRNPKLDESLLQTCHLFKSITDVTVRDPNGDTKTMDAERHLVIYLPHVLDPESIPFYHPKVRGVAILYTFLKKPAPDTAPGTLSIYYDLFPERPLDNRMSRTALKMIEIIHKHARGRMQGYQKRVHHDVIIPQKSFQDTYAYLKGKYAKELIDNWVEATPASKHVFEDLGIAAFMIELWTEMYGGVSSDSTPDPATNADGTVSNRPDDASKSDENPQRTKAQQSFPGFVDIGCGNGLLVNILNREGWTGWGFDARRRKTWLTFSAALQANLKEMLLVPAVLTPSSGANYDVSSEPKPVPAWYNGIAPPGTFIISNHADELTPWTPLLAYLSDSPFIAIPCCSHDLGGTRFRAPYHPEHFPPSAADAAAKANSKSKQVSAYTSLCSYAAYLTATMGYVVEKEHLRIPSTRNIAIVGRRRKEAGEEAGGLVERMEAVRAFVETEMGGETSIEQVRMQWLRRGSGLLKPEKGGH
jgi:tRNASer (uridine44-2'-O)-methyltransferase